MMNDECGMMNPGAVAWMILHPGNTKTYYDTYAEAKARSGHCERIFPLFLKPALQCHSREGGNPE